MEKIKIQILILRAQAGDETAFKQIYQEAKWLILKVCQKYTFYEWDHDDMQQEAQIILYQSLQKVQLPSDMQKDFRRQFFGFYQTNLNHHFLNQWRKENAQKRKHLHEIVEYDDSFNSEVFRVHDDPENYVVTKNDVLTISTLQLTLEECKLISSRLEGHSIRECAQILNRGTSYTNKLIKRIRKVFHQTHLFDDYLHD